MTVSGAVDESSLRYPGWRVVLACFLVAFFIFGFGLYGHAVYLAELQRLHGWSTGLISNASTLSFLLGSLLAAFTNDAMVRIGAGRLLLCGILALAASTTLLAFAQTPWQLYAAYILLACGWMGMGTVVIATIVSSWFDRRRGLAISIAFNGATCGGIIIAPTLVVLIGAIGFTRAMLTMTAVMIFVLVPVVIGLIGVSPGHRPSDQDKRGGAGIIAQRAAAKFRILDHHGAVCSRIAGAGRFHRASDRTAGAGDGPRAGRACRRGDDDDGRDRTALPRTGRRPP
jgi:MFS family permease